MFVKNSFEYDARVTKEASSLVEAGHDVTVIALHVPGRTDVRETTREGIRVIRVRRSSFGGAALNRFSGNYGQRIEARHARLVGEPIDSAMVMRHGSVAGSSTATPGDDPGSPTDTGDSQTITTALGRAWARVSTPLLRAVPALLRVAHRTARSLLGPAARRFQDRRIDRQMISEGVGVGADVYHAHDLNTLRVGVECKARVPGSQLVYDSHELQTERNRMSDRQRRQAKVVEQRGLSSVDAMIVASPAWIPWNSRLYGALPDPTCTILNVPRLEIPDPNELLRDELQIPHDTKILLYQGSIQQDRGIEPAIDALSLLDDVVLVVVGYGHHRPALEEYVSKLGLRDRVRFYGAIPNEDLVRYTASADVGLCNIVSSSVSYHTSLPNKLFEYAMAGIPVVGSDSPEIGRIVAKYRIGETCAPDDPDAIADAVRTILADPSRYRDGIEAARSRFNWDVESRTLIDLYAGLERR